jgi:hypothetical protein
LAIVEASTGEAVVKAIRIQREIRVTRYFMMMLSMSSLKFELIVCVKEAVGAWLCVELMVS